MVFSSSRNHEQVTRRIQLEGGADGASTVALQQQINNIDRRLAQVEDVPVPAQQGIQQMLRNTDHGHSVFTWFLKADGTFPMRPGVEDLQFLAGETVGGERVVYSSSLTEVEYADKDTADHEGRIVGVTLNAASLGDPVTVRRSGIVTEPAWTWTAGNPVFLANNGLMTQTPPASGFVVQIGTAVTATELFVNIGVWVETA